MNKWISRVSCKKPTRERAMWEAHARSWKVVLGCQFRECLTRRANLRDTHETLCLEDFKNDFLTLYPYYIYPYYPQKYDEAIQRDKS